LIATVASAIVFHAFCSASIKCSHSKAYIRILTTVLAKGTSAGWVPSEGEGIQKHCAAVFETSGWSPVARTKPCGLSLDLPLILLLPIK
jgi:hypothetical protein